MNWYTIDFNICGTGRVGADNEGDATRRLSELYPICIDVHDRSWFTTADSARLSDGMTVIGPVVGQALKPVSEAAMRIAMRPSVRGEKAFWVPRARLEADCCDHPVYTIEIAIVATAFIRAPSFIEAEAICREQRGQIIDMDDRWRWFYPNEEDADRSPLIFSPMMAIVGPFEEAEIALDEWEGCSRDDAPIAIKAYDRSSYDKDVDIESASAKLRKLLSGLGEPFSQISREDTSAIALVLKECFNRSDTAGN